MLAEERRLLIVDWTRNEGRLNAAEAAIKLNVATETVRRDLDVLQRRGALRKVHGGAIAMERFAHEYTIPERQNLNPDAKSASPKPLPNTSRKKDASSLMVEPRPSSWRPRFATDQTSLWSPTA